MAFKRPINLRSATYTIENEQIAIPSSPYQARLDEVPSSVEGVKIRRITDTAKDGTGSGMMTGTGFYVGLATRNYVIEIDTAGDVGTATFKWSNDGGNTWQGTLVPISDTEPFDLELGVQVCATEGEGQDFNLGDRFTFDAEYWTEVTSVPIASKTFQVDYANGLITFFSVDAESVVFATYEGRGGVVKAEDINQLIDALEQGEVVARNLNTSGLTANKAVYVAADGTFGLAGAGSLSTLASGFCKVVDESKGEIVVYGRMDGFSGLTPGAVYYLDVDGGITDAPSQAYRQAVGKALSATTLLVNCVLEEIEDVCQKVVLRGQNTGSLSLRQFVGFAPVSGWMAASNHWSTLKPAVGIVQKIGETDGEVLLKGLIGGFTGLTRGQRYYLGASGGGITTVPPSESGDIVQVVGWAFSTTELLVDIEINYQTVS